MAKKISIHMSELEVGEIVDINKGRITSGQVRIKSMSENKMLQLLSLSMEVQVGAQ